MRLNFLTNEELYMDMDAVCALFSISKSTARNWVKSQKLIPIETAGKKNLFLRSEVESLLDQIRSGKVSNLRSRRNKGFVTGDFIPKTYIQNKKGIENLKKIITQMKSIDLPEDFERVILAEYALKLMVSRGMVPVDSKEIFSNNAEKCFSDRSQGTSVLLYFLQHKEHFGCYSVLIDDLLIDIKDLERKINSIMPTLLIPMEYIEDQDLLGLLSMSLQNLGERKSNGVYYTPLNIVKEAVDHLESFLNENKKLLDPCCGTGNFLMYAYKYIKKLDRLFGYDISSLSVSLTRINMALVAQTDNMDLLYRNFLCKDPLTSTSTNRFDVVIGNPPWGYNYDNKTQEELKGLYSSAQVKTVESFCIFTEYAINAIDDSGIVTLVLPQSILNVKIHQPIRDYVMANTKVKRVRYWDDVFDGVQCPAITLTFEKSKQGFGIKGLEVATNKRKFKIKSDRILDRFNWSFKITDEEMAIIHKIESSEKNVYLKNKAVFALGIVTGDNKRFLSNIWLDGFEPIYRGSDIFKYKCSPAQNYIKYEPNQWQQVATTETYRIEEKLIYRFIGGNLVFAYDNTRALTLNSANIVIPKIDGLNMKYILAILNSRVIQYYYNKKFDSVKILRSHIEQLPIPAVDSILQSRIVEKVDYLLKCNDPKRIFDYYDEIDMEINQIFGLLDSEYEYIKSEALSSNSFYMH